MPRPHRPPLNGKVILEARLSLGLSQEDVQQLCADRGRPVYNLSRFESGQVRWPSPRILPTLAAVLGLQVGDLLDDGTEGEAPAGQAADIADAA